jgi:hypothetical protein
VVESIVFHGRTPFIHIADSTGRASLAIDIGASARGDADSRLSGGVPATEAQVGTMEPTTMSALALMERSGFVQRSRNAEDRRKVNIYLTERGRALQRELLPAAIAVVEIATRPFTSRELQIFLSLLTELRKNLREDLQSQNHLNEQSDLGEAP